MMKCLTFNTFNDGRSFHCSRCNHEGMVDHNLNICQTWIILDQREKKRKSQYLCIFHRYTRCGIPIHHILNISFHDHEHIVMSNQTHHTSEFQMKKWLSLEYISDDHDDSIVYDPLNSCTLGIEPLDHHFHYIRHIAY